MGGYHISTFRVKNAEALQSLYRQFTLKISYMEKTPRTNEILV